MKRILFLFLFFVLFFPGLVSASRIGVINSDGGSVSDVFAYKIIWPTGDISIDANGVLTYTPSAGSGDVTGVGDCASGACLDGSSDGGTYIRLYDGTGNYGQLSISGALGGDVTYYLDYLSYLDQDVTSGSSPTFDGTNFTGIPAAGISDQNAGTDITADLEEEDHVSEHYEGGDDALVDNTPDNGGNDAAGEDWAYDHVAALNPHVATGVYNCTALTGGAAGALDSFSDAVLVDNNLAICRLGTQLVYMFLFDADGTGAESSPNVIRPDDYDTGVWELFAYWADGVLQLVSLAENLPFSDGDGTGSIVFSFDTSAQRTITAIDVNMTIPAATEINTSGQVNHVVLDDNTSIEYLGDADGMDDDEYNGDIITGRNCGENLTQWDTVFINNDADPWHQADADAAGEFPAIGMSVAACTDTNEAKVLVRGIVRNEGWTGLTIGGAVYLSDTAGGITQTAPSTSGDCVQIVGWALSDSEIYFDFSRPYQEVQ